MDTNPSSRGLLLYPALLCIWLAVSVAALFYTDLRIAMAGTLVLAALAVTALSVFSTALIWGVTAITIIVFGVMIDVLFGISSKTIFTFITFSTAAIGTAILAWNTSKQFMNANRQVERDRILIEEMRINDQKTGLMRFHYARRALSNEISRSLRYGKKLSLMLIKINHWDELAEKIGLESREHLLVEVCETMFNTVRNVDTLFINIDKIGAILPETNNVGAEVIARRLVENVKKKTKEDLRIGIAGFPDDSIVEDDLINKAEIAMLTSIREDRDISYYASQVDTGISASFETNSKILDEIKLNDSTDDDPKRLKPGEMIIRFDGVCNLGDIEILQKALEKITEIKSTRLIDFAETEISFAVNAPETKLAECLLTKLDLPNITIAEKGDSINVMLDPSSLHR